MGLEKSQILGSQPEQENESFNTLLKWARRAVLPATWLSRIMLVAGSLALLVGLLGWYYFVIELGWVFWGWTLSVLLGLIPALSAFFFWYAFSLVHDLPQVLEEFKSQSQTLLPRYKRFALEKEQRKGLLRKAHFSVRLAVDLYNITDNVEGAISGVTVLTFAASPPAWIFAMGSLALCVIGPLLFGIIFLAQLLFS